MNQDNIDLSPFHRYSRQVLLPQIGLDGQKKLSEARVLCIGAGGLGSQILLNLASAGVGTIGIADFDTVSLTNLHRQIIYNENDIGQQKVDAAQARLKHLNTSIKIQTHPNGITADNIEKIVGQYDLIVDGSDNFYSRYIIGDACALFKKPLIWGSVFQFEGQVSVFLPDKGPCHRCLYPNAPEDGTVPSCNDAGVFGTTCSIIGALQATEVAKHILGKDSRLVGNLMIADIFNTTFDIFPIKKRPDCLLCSKHPSILTVEEGVALCGLIPNQSNDFASMTPLTLSNILKSPENILLVDVREPWEHEQSHITSSVLIPTSKLVNERDYRQIPDDKPIVIYCKSGIRSKRVAYHLSQLGYKNVSNLNGGIETWVDAGNKVIS